MSITNKYKITTDIIKILYNFFYKEKTENIINIKNSISSPKKQVKFSENVEIRFIQTIDEFKEFLPDMYWNYDNKDDTFLPLKHMKFVYELELKNDKKNNNYNILIPININKSPTMSVSFPSFFDEFVFNYENQYVLCEIPEMLSGIKYYDSKIIENKKCSVL